MLRNQARKSSSAKTNKESPLL